MLVTPICQRLAQADQRFRIKNGKWDTIIQLENGDRKDWYVFWRVVWGGNLALTVTRTRVMSYGAGDSDDANWVIIPLAMPNLPCRMGTDENVRHSAS